jgi:D-alanyl-lipoteichoic acid acyltransferase DltB (MBOAT superfamily)
VVLLVASYFFYINMSPAYAIILAGITLSTFVFTRLMADTDDEKRKQRLKVINIVIIVAPLLFYKYIAAINNEVFELLDSMEIRYPLPEIKFLLPIGISFYTFMAVGYTIDVYNEEIEVERNPGILALFISFFPLVLSGPIERAKNMLPQFNSINKIDYDKINLGLKLMLWGYFMKLVVADRIGIYINEVYAHLEDHNGSTLILTTLLYPFQVYGDLGGYTLIAIGTARVLGFDVMPNFRRPFFSVSIAEFWRRWHMSLITWITDYIYTPMSFALRKYRRWGIVMALFLAFLISGIWHGAKVTYVVWGLTQGAFLSVEAMTVQQRKAFRERFNLASKAWFIALCCVIVYLLFAASQIFGRATTMADSGTVFTKIATEGGMPYLDVSTLALAALGIGLLLLSDFRDEFFPGKFELFENKYFPVRFLSCLAVFFMIIFLGVSSDAFIYFQF